MPENNNSAMNSEVQDLYTGKITQNGRTDIQILESIEKQIEQLVKNGGNISNMSASNANNRYGRNGSTFYQSLNGRGGARGTFRDFEKEFKKEMFEGLLGTEFKKSMSEIRNQLAKDLGVELGDLPKSLGSLAGKMLSKQLRESALGKSLLDPLNKAKADLAKQMKNAYSKATQPYRKSGKAFDGMQWGGNASMPDIGDVTSSVAGEASKQVSSTLSKGVTEALGSGEGGGLVGTLGNLSQNAIGVDGAMAGLQSVLTTVGPKLLSLSAATMGLTLALDYGIEYFKKAIKPAVDDFKKVLAQVSESLQRYEKSRQNNLDESRKRLNADIQTMAEAPFDILRKAAEQWYETWDNTLRNISATQGYTKDQVYQLYGSYVDRLRSEGLTDIIGATDIVNSLSNVLSAGLQGAAAEEFAYLATKLNAAIPTQDFFNYTEGYITAVSNAMNQGRSQAEAIAMANEELETFANSLLYAGREISGGFTVGLKGAESLFQKAEQIAQAGRYGSGTQLGSTLTAISAITGAIAPDLASGIVDAVYKAAVGGNASDIVALRSLAGINASNTEFLQAIVNNPQQVFGDLFSKLNVMQNMSNGAYMEVAEGLSSIFGISMDSLARVDFGQLASAVKASANPNSALNQNMKLLTSGQTTTNAEILKMRQINQYIADEGLQYVLDNEAGRQVLQHEWDEQIARELMETTYGVELTGKALQFLNSLSNTVNKLLSFSRVDVMAKKSAELQVTAEQESALKDDIKKMLELGKVGAGNLADLANLTTYNKNLQLTDTYVELLGGTSSFRKSQATISAIRNAKAPLGLGGGYDQNAILGAIGKWADINNPFSSSSSSSSTPSYSAIYNSPIGPMLPNSGLSSAYQWNRVGKSSLRYGGMYALPDYDLGGSVVSTSAVAASAQAQSRLNTNLQKMLDSMDDFYGKDNTRSFEEFVATAKQYGIADYQKALEQGGLTEEDVRNRYEELKNQTAIAKQAERNRQEEDFWEKSLLELTASNSWLEGISSTATSILTLFDDFVDAWKDYFIEHTVYNNAYTRDAVEKVLSAERDSSETAIYALADALTQNDIGLLRDPTLQTNALLSQILKVANAILVQSGSGATSISLPDTIAGLSLGIVNPE